VAAAARRILLAVIKPSMRQRISTSYANLERLLTKVPTHRGGMT